MPMCLAMFIGPLFFRVDYRPAPSKPERAHAGGCPSKVSSPSAKVTRTVLEPTALTTTALVRGRVALEAGDARQHLPIERGEEPGAPLSNYLTPGGRRD